MTCIAPPGSGGTVSFKYDPFGRRIYKSSSAATSIYAYDLDNLVEETNASGTAVARYAQSGLLDEPLAMLRGGATSYYDADGLGSVTSLSNTAGSLAQTYAYDSFGNLTASSGSLTNPFRYTARESDSETGLYYYRARYYDPNVGRFVSEDPIGFKGGINFYRYASNNPVNLSDPFGLNPAPAIPWPWPWFPPGSGVLGRLVGGAAEVLGKLAIPITVIYSATLGADATGIDDARAIPKPKPCDRDKPDPDACKLLFLADVAHCNTAFPRGSPEHTACLATAALNYEKCKGNMPGVREPLPGLPDK